MSSSNYFKHSVLMSSIETYSFILFGIVFAILVWTFCEHYYYEKFLNYPRGPFPWPVVGNVLQVDQRHMYLSFMEWSKQYGKIMSVKLGFRRALVINDATRVRELFNELEFSGRPQPYFATVLNGGGPNGILLSDGAVWEEQRQFTLSYLRNFRFGEDILAKYVLEDALEIVDWMKSESGHPLPNLQKRLTLAVLNSLWAVVSGQRVSHEDKTLNSLFDSLQEGAKEVTRHPLILAAPWLRFLIPGVSGYRRFQEGVDEMAKYFRDAIDKHMEGLSETSTENPRDFIEAYLEKIHKTADTNSSFYGEMGEKNLRAAVGDLFQGGAEATGLTLTWAILFLMTHKKVQKKLQKEIDMVIGPTRNPTLYDRHKMIYTQAVILETARMASVSPLGIFHSSLVDTHFHDFFIPKDTWLFANLYAIHMDSHVWGNPQQFCPERFLSKDGTKLLRSHENLLPFSTGKRECIGKCLSTDAIFLFITIIFQRFIAVPADDEKEPDILNSNDGFFRAPKKFHVLMKERATTINNPIEIRIETV